MTPYRIELIALAATLALAACQPMRPDGGTAAAPSSGSPDTPASSPPMADAPAPPTSAPSDTGNPCGADEAREFVGRTATPSTRAELEAAARPASIRWVGPGMATTEDYSETRLNVMLDAGDTIVSAHCG